MSYGAVFYRGPSLLTGDPVVGIAAGLEGESHNPKTGPMVQTYVLRSDRGPMDAVRDGSDDAICGDCKLRGEAGRDRKCYVTPFFGPLQVYKQFIAGTYPDATWREMQALVEGRALRLCQYGDPAAVPFDVWRLLTDAAETTVAYTHSWRICDPRLKTIAMASVDTINEFIAAGLLGWRTFRILRPGETPIAGGEFRCPASDEMHHRSTCADCRLCRGTSSPARSVAIEVHGKPSSLKAFGIHVPFFKRRADLISDRHATQPIRTLTEDSAAVNPAVRRRGHDAAEARDPQTGVLQPPLRTREGTGQVAGQRPVADQIHLLRSKDYLAPTVPA